MQQVNVKMVEEKEGRENRESGITLAQVRTKNNDAAKHQETLSHVAHDEPQTKL